MKTPKPITDEASEAANYSNEGGVGYNRYQKNIMGMWLVNGLKRDLCPAMTFPEIVKAAEESACDILVDANASEFLAPKSMKAAFDAATNGRLKTIGDYFRCAYRTLAVSQSKGKVQYKAPAAKLSILQQASYWLTKVNQEKRRRIFPAAAF